MCGCYSKSQATSSVCAGNPRGTKAREPMADSSNLVIAAVGADTDEITQIARKISSLGLEIDDKSVIEDECHTPYTLFGPENIPKVPSLIDFMSLAEDAEVVEFTVSEGARVANMTIEQAVGDGLLADEVLVVGIERDGNVLTPKGETVIQPEGVISLFSKSPPKKILYKYLICNVFK